MRMHNSQYINAIRQGHAYGKEVYVSPPPHPHRASHPSTYDSLDLSQSITPEQQIQMKVMLKHQLNQGQVSNMPHGFPFHYVPDYQGGAKISYGPYEFRQELDLSSHWGPRCVWTAKFSFVPPSSRRDGQYVWTISLPTVSSCSRNSRASREAGYTISAEVQLDAGIARTPYFAEVQSHKSMIISRALAISLEFSVRLRICLADHQLVASLTPLMKGSRALLAVGDIVYLGTNTEGQQQLLYVLDHRTMSPKFSAAAAGR
ncbi:hypothetical protein CC2G_014060 [Coprinopsis cinerea AmutBmut pab1-1]|nr:hypothetical protein CC2G_014060 [Coprinopsis cinerea AmutBmut pab1-1]